MTISVRYRVVGMDCADDAAEIESAVRSLPGVHAVKVSTATRVMTVGVDDAERTVPLVEEAVGRIGYQLSAMEVDTGAAGRSGESMVDEDELPRDLSHISAAYKRALWIVVLMNTGYGVIEMVGGFVSGSQALKADALDFLGDGLITLLGLIAIGWSLRWRARSALIQGLFLGALGLSVLGATVYRIVVQQQPEAELMGTLGFIALLVNVGAAFVLVPHRAGDANVRAVWLFSRNDAIGNAAVVLAALLVGWTGSAWPDLVVAAIIGGLFLHSSWHIVTDAVAELREQ